MQPLYAKPAPSFDGLLSATPHFLWAIFDRWRFLKAKGRLKPIQWEPVPGFVPGDTGVSPDGGTVLVLDGFKFRGGFVAGGGAAFALNRVTRWVSGSAASRTCAGTTPLNCISAMPWAFIQSFVIAVVGAILFLLVVKYEEDGPIPRLIKFLVLFAAGLAIMHKLEPFGLTLF
jgi:hypothetical protein